MTVEQTGGACDWVNRDGQPTRLHFPHQDDAPDAYQRERNMLHIIKLSIVAVFIAASLIRGNLVEASAAPSPVESSVAAVSAR